MHSRNQQTKLYLNKNDIIVTNHSKNLLTKSLDIFRVVLDVIADGNGVTFT